MFPKTPRIWAMNTWKTEKDRIRAGFAASDWLGAWSQNITNLWLDTYVSPCQKINFGGTWRNMRLSITVWIQIRTKLELFWPGQIRIRHYWQENDTANKQEFCLISGQQDAFFPLLPLPLPSKVIYSCENKVKTVHAKQCKHYVMAHYWWCANMAAPTVPVFHIRTNTLLMRCLHQYTGGTDMFPPIVMEMQTGSTNNHIPRFLG